jgi:hypothetical protein
METVEFEQFLNGYTEALYWSAGEEFDGLEESREAAEMNLQDCQRFWNEFRGLIDAAADVYGYAQAGHDLALTRNHHGAGYWDGDLPEALGEALTGAAQADTERHPYIGDDGLIYISICW